ncbi:MAG: hypothetical protein Fur005_20570 [Roseiflexaceae bacterium]
MEGQLGSISVRDLIQMIAFSSITGVLEINTADQVLQLYFYEGRPTHANTADLRGIDAVGFMFEQHQGYFKFHRGVTCEDETIWNDASELIARGETLARIWAPIREHIPSSAWIPTLIHTESNIKLNTELWSILIQIDGTRSVAAIAESTPFGLLDVSRAIMMLKQRGVVTLRPPATPLATRQLDAPEIDGMVDPHTTPTTTSNGAIAAAPHQADPPQPNRNGSRKPGGFFERMIERAIEDEAKKPNSRYTHPRERYKESNDQQ